MRRSARGFTLLETLVALAIVAIALTSALRAMGATAQSAGELRDRTLALCVAQNRLAELRARRAWPPVGRSEGRAVQGVDTFVWRQQVGATPNPLFRRVEVRVSGPGGRELASLTGYATRSPR